MHSAALEPQPMFPATLSTQPMQGIAQVQASPPKKRRSAKEKVPNRVFNMVSQDVLITTSFIGTWVAWRSMKILRDAPEPTCPTRQGVAWTSFAVGGFMLAASVAAVIGRDTPGAKGVVLRDNAWSLTVFASLSTVIFLSVGVVWRLLVPADDNVCRNAAIDDMVTLAAIASAAVGINRAKRWMRGEPVLLMP